MSTREEKKQRTRQAIIQAAINLFSANGFENTSIEELAKVAGVGKGTIYGYFQTKKEILRAFCEYALEQIHKDLVSKTNPEAPILEQMLTIYMTEFNHVTQNREFGRIFMRQTVFPDESDVKGHAEIEDKYFELLFPIIEKAKERGELRKEIEPLHLTAHFYSLYVLLMSAWYSGRIPTTEVDSAMELLFRQTLEGLQPTPLNI
ncbi:MAG: TetR/AcrR family transcriptional regulator [Deltaproteobacteria bacterium]|nr:TetR/AcrR family transcriptional regulator [Deltaproteobacteria bacterium]